VLLYRYCQQGDEEAFAEIVRRHAGLVYATCQRVLNNPAKAQEAAQETFLRLIRKPHAVSKSLAGWLHHAAAQLAIDMVRSEASRTHREAEHVRDMQLLKAREVKETTRWADVSPLVDECLSEMPQSARELLVAHFLDGRSQQELAEDMRTSSSTISRQMKAALEVLREKLKHKGVWVAAGLLPVLFANHAAEAAPASLVGELGKMAMISGRAPAPIGVGSKHAVSAHSWLGAARYVGIGVLLLALVIPLWSFVMMLTASAKPAPIPAGEERKAPPPVVASRES